MTSIVQQGSSLSSCPTFTPLNPHYNQPLGHWPCVKSCLVGGSDKYISDVGVFFSFIFFKCFCCIFSSIAYKCSTYSKKVIWHRVNCARDKIIFFEFDDSILEEIIKYNMYKKITPPKKADVLDLTLNCIWWWGYNSWDLWSVESPFIATEL